MTSVTPFAASSLIALTLIGCGDCSKQKISGPDIGAGNTAFLTAMETTSQKPFDPIACLRRLRESGADVGEPFVVYPCTVGAGSSTTTIRAPSSSDYALVYYPVRFRDAGTCALLCEHSLGRFEPVGWGFSEFVQQIESTHLRIRDTSGESRGRLLIYFPEIHLYFFRDGDSIVSPFNNSLVGLTANRPCEIRFALSKITALIQKIRSSKPIASASDRTTLWNRGPSHPQ